MDPLITIVGLFLFIGLGVFTKYLLGKYKLIDHIIQLFSEVIYYIILPLVFMDTFAKRGLELADLSILVVSFTYVATSIVVLSFIPFKKNGELKKAVLLMSTFQNNIFLGFPVLLLIYNDISAAAMYSLVIFILHISVAGLLAGGRENILYSVAKIPILYGFILGTLVHYTVYRQYILIAFILSPFHYILSYGAVYVLGYTLPLTLGHIKEYMGALYITSIWRLGVSPLIHYLLLLIVQVPLLYYKEIMILSFLPPAVMNTVVARIYGWKPEVVASITMILTLITLGIIPVIMFVGQ